MSYARPFTSRYRSKPRRVSAILFWIARPCFIVHIYATIIPFSRQKKKSVSSDFLLNFLLDVVQKTLPVLVAVVEQLGGALGESGLLVIPCVAAHIIQVLIAHAVLLFTLAFCQDSRHF